MLPDVMHISTEKVKKSPYAVRIVMVVMYAKLVC